MQVVFVQTGRRTIVRELHLVLQFVASDGLLRTWTRGPTPGSPRCDPAGRGSFPARSISRASLRSAASFGIWRRLMHAARGSVMSRSGVSEPNATGHDVCHVNPATPRVTLHVY